MSQFLSRLSIDSLVGLCLLGILGVVGLSGLMLLPVLVGGYVDYLGLSEAEAGWVSGINLAGIAVMTLVFSLNALRWSLYRVVIGGLIVMIAFDLLSIFSISLLDLMAYRFGSGLGGGAIQAAVAAAIARTTNSERGFGIYIGLQFILPAIAFYLLPVFLLEHGIAGLMSVLITLEIVFLYFALIVKNYQLEKIPQTSAAIKSEWRLIRSKPALLSILALCFYGIANAGFYAYVERFGLSSGFSAQEVGSILSVVNIVSVLGAILVFYMGPRFGYLRPLTVGIGLQVLSMQILLLPNSWSYIAGVFLWSIAWAFSWPYFLSMQANFDRSGTVVAAGQFSNLVGNSLGPVMFSFSLTAGNYHPLIVVTAVFFVVSLLPMFSVAKVLPRRSII